jgi:hypothetical protein
VSNLVVHTQADVLIKSPQCIALCAAADGMFRVPVFDINNIRAFMALV